MDKTTKKTWLGVLVALLLAGGGGVYWWRRLLGTGEAKAPEPGPRTTPQPPETMRTITIDSYKDKNGYWWTLVRRDSSWNGKYGDVLNARYASAPTFSGKTREDVIQQIEKWVSDLGATSRIR